MPAEVAASADPLQDARMLENPFEGPKVEDARVAPRARGGGAWEGELSVGAIAGEAWGLVRGTKGPMFLALLGILVAYGLSSVVSSALGLDGQAQMLEGNLVAGLTRSMLGSLLLLPLTAPPTAVLTQMALTRARGGAPGFEDVRRVLDKAVPVIIVALLGALGAFVTLVVGVVIGGIVFSLLTASASTLVLGYGLSPVEALTTSIKGSWSNFGVAFMLGLIGVGALLAAILTLGIFGLWAMPYLLLSVSVFTLRVFGPPTEPA